MAKVLLVENCGECRNCDGITSTKGEYKCREMYTDERKINRRVIPNWHEIPKWCPLHGMIGVLFHKLTEEITKKVDYWASLKW